MTADEPGPQLLAGPDAIAASVARVAAAISADHPGGVTLVGVLKGAVVFLADLARLVTVPARIELVAVAPFDGSTGRTRVVKDLDQPVDGADVVLVSGIHDTGLTADFLGRHLVQAGATSVRVAAFADKPVRRILPAGPSYAALVAPDRFLVGYGLDYRGRYRNLRGLWGVEAAALASDPDRYVAQLYGPDAGGVTRRGEPLETPPTAGPPPGGGR